MTKIGKQSGLSLTEIIVAAALALIGFLVALVLYQAARQAFKKGELATDQQQEIRVAYDRMLKDLRLAGYNWNATGDDRPGEEQIEGAWSGAITIRGDYDFEDVSLSLDPEDLIRGSTGKATIGNDEIVTFCLRKPDGTGGASLVFAADVNSSTTASSGLYGTVAQRDGTNENVTIPNVDMAQNNPPYNLYRVVLNNTASTFGSPNFVQYQLLAENVRSLTFTYLDAAGNPLTAPGGTETGSPDPRLERAKIRKVNVTIVGMTSIPDPSYTDPTDTNVASQHFRKFSLSTQITPRNLGFKGRADTDLSPPTVPTGLAICPGHCNAMLVRWNPNPTDDAVTQYDVKYGTNPSTMTSVLSTSQTSYYIQSLTAGATYYFAVRAADAGGNRSSYTANVSAVVNDVTYPSHTIPAQPVGFTATGHGSDVGLNGHIDLSWSAVNANETALACDPSGTILRDFSGYRLYRDTSAGFAPGTTNLVANETVLNGSTTTYTDGSTINCRSYFYHLRAVDLTACSNESQVWAGSWDGKAESTMTPETPAAVTATRTGATSAIVTWSAVTRDTDVPAQTIPIDTYKLWSAQIAVGQDPETEPGGNWGLAGTFAPAPVTGTITWVDASAPPDIPGRKLYYKVSAIDDCPNESARSAASEAVCTFNGAIAITPPSSPPSLDLTAQIVSVSASGTDTFVQATITIDKVGGFQDLQETTVATGNVWNFNWIPSQGPGTYIATAAVVNANGCVRAVANRWDVVLSACATCVQIVPLNPTPQGGPPRFYLQPNQLNNNCFFDIVVKDVQLRAQSICASCANPLRLLRMQFRASGNFVDETSDVVYTALSPGDPISTTQSVTIDLSGQPAGGLLLAGGTTARTRFVFDTTTPIWDATSRQSILQGNFSLLQTTNLCTPSSTGFTKLQID